MSNEQPEQCRHRLRIHRLGVEILCAVPGMNLPIHRALGEFAVDERPAISLPAVGRILPYDEKLLIRHLSTNATALSCCDPEIEVYQDAERFWIVDERWGICEINLLRGTWQSWVLPQAALDPPQLIERAVIFPLAQLVRAKGLWLLPSVSMTAGEHGVLVISPFEIEREVAASLANGARLIGQQWSAIKLHDDRATMLRMPSRVPQSRRCELASCDAVIIVDRSRRPLPLLRLMPREAAIARLKHVWPIPELHPHHRTGLLATKLAQCCTCYEAQLSRDPDDFVRMLQQIARLPAPQLAVPPRVAISIHPQRSTRIAA
jgi:hypothetical protein